MTALADPRTGLLAILVTILVTPCWAETLVVGASQDTSIFEEDGNLSNGAGVGLFAGRTAGRQGTSIRRALIQFDVSGIPQGATIGSVTVSLTKQLGTASSLTLHRLQQVWGESGSDAGLPGGKGASAQPGDATWTRNLVLTQSWTTPGGTFVSASSSSASTGSSGQVDWQGSGLIDDVQYWRDDPNENFGWILMGDESTGQSAQRFGSSESDKGPQLTIVFSTGSPSRTLALSLGGPGGEASGGGDFSDGSAATITATASPGFEFSQWFGDGVTDPESATTTVLMTEDRTVVAAFRAIPGIALSVIATPESGGMVSGAGTFPRDTVVLIAATPNSGYRFKGWQGNGIDDVTQAETTIIAINGNGAHARFVKQWIITTNSSDESLGSTTGSTVVDDGTQVALTATPNLGVRFVRWVASDGQTFSEAELALTATGDLTLTAQFAWEHTLTMSADPKVGGSVSGGGAFENGSEAPIEAVAAEGFRFAGWLGEGIANPMVATTCVALTEDRAVTAAFIKVWPLTITANPAEGGDTDGAGSFDSDTEAPINATAAEGFRFDRWEGEGLADHNNANTTVSMTAHRAVTALFTAQFDLVIAASPADGGTVSGGGTFDQGTEAAISATPAEGFRFVRWDGEGIAEPDNVTTAIAMNEARVVTAIFIRQVVLSMNSSPPDGGATTGAGAFDEGADVAISATPAEGFQFVGWIGDGVADPVNTITTVIVAAELSITAQFALVETDADGDGLDDEWELANGLDPNDPLDAAADGDHDGQTNWEEFLAGTNPNDSRSAFVVQSIQIDANGNVEAVWSSVPGITYSIESSNDLVPTSWSEIGQLVADSEQSRTSMAIDQNALAAYLRVRIVLNEG